MTTNNTSFAGMKSMRQSTLDMINKELNKLNTNASQEDNRFWRPSTDKAGNGSATVRFLPAPKGEDLPFVRLFTHGFKGPTGLWYIENSLTSINKADPCSEYNGVLWNVSTDDNSPTRKQARAQKRRLNYISNILVIKDPANPENEGKVFLFQYGKKLFDKINEAMHPQFEDETAFNPFDLWEGANFKIKIRQVEGYRNYDKSEFDDVAPVSKDDSAIEAIWEKEHSLSELIDASKFKSYDELKLKLAKVLGQDGVASSAKKSIEDTADAPKPKAKEAVKEQKDAPEEMEEDIDKFFESLSED